MSRRPNAVHDRRWQADEEDEDDEEVVHAKVRVCDPDFGDDAQDDDDGGDGAHDDCYVDELLGFVANRNAAISIGRILGSFQVLIDISFIEISRYLNVLSWSLMVQVVATHSPAAGRMVL